MKHRKKILLYEIDNVINTITTNYRKKIYCIPGNIRPPPPRFIFAHSALVVRGGI